MVKIVARGQCLRLLFLDVQVVCPQDDRHDRQPEPETAACAVAGAPGMDGVRDTRG